MAKTEIKNILISQPAPADLENSQYKVLMDKYKVKLTFNKFFDVVSISNREFRAQKINILEYSGVIMTSKLAVDNYFHFVSEMRIKIPDTMKFFCITDSIANYLQNYIQYRKRKIFYGKLTFDELVDTIIKHSGEKLLFPCAEDARQENFKKLDAKNIEYTKVVMYKSTPKKNMQKEININDFDMVVLFSPIGVRSFLMNFPEVTSDDLRFAAFGKGTVGALNRVRMKVSVTAPTIKCPSMVMALDNYLSSLQKDTTESANNKGK
ncbi:MAG: uroporphyrinogen-III synthase [Bacteroidales bacterium]|nr:uroporphyrinogen-III synthase [Bacteroidales bacterium]